MHDMFDSIAQMFSAWGPSGGNHWMRAHNTAMLAYEAAWKSRRSDDSSVDLLIRELKSHNVPGAYTGPEHRADLAVWFDSWESGIEPEEVREILRRSAEAHKESRR